MSAKHDTGERQGQDAFGIEPNAMASRLMQRRMLDAMMRDLASATLE